MTILRPHSTGRAVVELKRRQEREDYPITVAVVIFILGFILGFFAMGIISPDRDYPVIPKGENYYEQTRHDNYQPA